MNNVAYRLWNQSNATKCEEGEHLKRCWRKKTRKEWKWR